jgi:hypothetical protein
MTTTEPSHATSVTLDMSSLAAISGEQRQRGKGRRHNERFDVDRPRLPPHFLGLAGIHDSLLSRIHVAQTARCKSYSRSIARLEEAKTGNKERDKDGQAQQWSDTRDDAQDGDHDAHGERDNSRYEPLAPPLRADIGDARR